MIYNIRKIKRIDDSNKIEGKIIKEEVEITNNKFPTPGTKIKVSNKYMTIHSVDLPKNTSKNRIINVL